MQTLNPYLAPILDELELFFNGQPLSNEHQIIKHLQAKEIPPFAHFSLSLTQDLFSAHFLCMHALYHLKKRYRAMQTFHLVIESVRVERIPVVEKVQPEAQTAIETSDPLADYYLNPSHYFETQVDEINELLKSFWQQYIAQDNKQSALATLGLPANADAKMIKTQYLRLAQQHHPDKGGCAEQFTKIRQAKAELDKLI